MVMNKWFWITNAIIKVNVFEETAIVCAQSPEAVNLNRKKGLDLEFERSVSKRSWVGLRRAFRSQGSAFLPTNRAISHSMSLSLCINCALHSQRGKKHRMIQVFNPNNWKAAERDPPILSGALLCMHYLCAPLGRSTPQPATVFIHALFASRQKFSNFCLTELAFVLSWKSNRRWKKFQMRNRQKSTGLLQGKCNMRTLRLEALQTKCTFTLWSLSTAYLCGTVFCSCNWELRIHCLAMPLLGKVNFFVTSSPYRFQSCAFCSVLMI